MRMLGTTLALLGGLLVTNVPLLLSSDWNKQDAKSKLENEVEKWDDWAVINEDADSRKLQYYHYIVDGNRDIEDSEDSYQEYVWKVDKIVSHKRRGNKPFYM